jgi:hypothetical protein
MVDVRLEKEWTDGAGVVHSAGSTVDVDAATLAALQAEGIVGGEKTDWVGATGAKEGAEWVGATGDPT